MTTLKVAVDPIMRPVRAFYATDSSKTHVEGICIAVLPSPSLIIRTPDGRDVAWLADLCEVTGEEVSDLPPAPSLVVIDPEDREQVERLWIILRDGLALRSRDNLQAALREFANPTPPKPEEPTTWLAAVEDADGNRWCLHGGPTEPGLEWYSPDLNCRAAYADIDAVRVLSEGWSA